jgi:putative transposase
MPGRKVVIATDEVYHVINRGIASQPVFLNTKDYQRAVNTFYFYRNKKTPMRYSKFLELSLDKRQKILKNLNIEKDFLIEIMAYCFMPNHFHFLIRQVVNNGISQFISKFSNSYTRYFNTKRSRNGPLFQGKFKAVRIETDEQLLHVSRYIHLNPYSSFLIKNISDLPNYAYSSFPEYLGRVKINFCSKKDILGQFKNFKAYKKFVFNQADYQRELQTIKHLLLEGV